MSHLISLPSWKWQPLASFPFSIIYPSLAILLILFALLLHTILFTLCFPSADLCSSSFLFVYPSRRSESRISSLLCRCQSFPVCNIFLLSISLPSDMAYRLWWLSFPRPTLSRSSCLSLTCTHLHSFDVGFFLFLFFFFQLHRLVSLALITSDIRRRFQQ